MFINLFYQLLKYKTALAFFNCFIGFRVEPQKSFPYRMLANGKEGIHLSAQIRPVFVRFLKCKKRNTFTVLRFSPNIECPRRDLNPHLHCCKQDFKSCVSTNSTTRALAVRYSEDKKNSKPGKAWNFAEQKTRFEPATPTLARLCSTS